MTPFLKYAQDQLEAFENEEIDFEEAIQLIREYAEDNYIGA